MSNHDTEPFAYRDAAGARHRLLARRNQAGAWQVLDITVVETLHGEGDGRAAAEALARDYAAQHYHPDARTGHHPTEQQAAA